MHQQTLYTDSIKQEAKEWRQSKVYSEAARIEMWNN